MTFGCELPINNNRESLNYIWFKVATNNHCVLTEPLISFGFKLAISNHWVMTEPLNDICFEQAIQQSLCNGIAIK